MRSLDEWIGKTDDAKVPPRVRLRVLERHGRICHISKREIMPGEKWELDHIEALANGGEHRERNLAPALVAPHREKTRADVAEKSKTYRTRAKHLGIKTSRGFRQHPTLYRGVDGQVRERRS